MYFKGGVIIIGSLWWEETPIRDNWRRVCLKDKNTRIHVPLKIRYGRESKVNRRGTYTMMFSNHESTGIGQGLIIEFQDAINSFRMLEKQAFALARAEGIWGGDNAATLNSTWGTVGLLISPSIDEKDKLNADQIRSLWSDHYRGYKSFNPEDFQIGKEPSVIDSNGFLKIDWVKEMNEFDYLIAMPVVPKPKKILVAAEIAAKMDEKRYWEYFKNNIANNITTFQDKEIQEFLKVKQ